MGNTWWTVNNLNCGINVNIENTCCSNFTQIVEIQPIKRLSKNITKFTFGTNLFIKQHKRIYDHKTPINLIKRIKC
jgi:hypothetical protein